MEKEITVEHDLVPPDNLPESVKGFLGLPVVRQLALLISTAASVALIAVVVLWSMKPDMSILFGGLEGKEATEIVDALMALNVEYKLDSMSGAVMVPSDRLHDIRLQLASQGLPRSSGLGLEILQQKPEFGTSQFMEIARYQHAIEGELAKSITAIHSVRSARVHLALPKQSAFVRKKERASASVLVNLFSGRQLEESQVDAISHLVAASVPNMEPADVTIIDERGNLLSDKQNRSALNVSEEQLKYTRMVENTYIDRVVSILGPIVGEDKIRAQIAADIDFTATEKTMESYNPDLPALRSEQVVEEERVGAAPIGIPGALANQPPGAGNAPEDAVGANGGTRSSSKNLQATRNYELDRTISHISNPMGQVKRLSIAVVLDHKLDENGEPIERSVDELERLTALIKEAVGYSGRRGDTINVMNTRFEGLNSEPIVLPEIPIWEQAWFIDVIKLVLGFLLVVLFLLVVIRPMLGRLAESNRMQVAEELALAEGLSAAMKQEEADANKKLGLDGLIELPTPGAYEENLQMVAHVTKNDPALVAQVVRKWIGEGGR
ncbi:flagellar basal body M-ring protein FliF [Ectothiorhodospiraceae bacterium BW-2]|nr:flagellar basal body M-ring protein FliF [Ectothiorhodospiraceae bacterium BW-2]